MIFPRMVAGGVWKGPPPLSPAKLNKIFKKLLNKITAKIPKKKEIIPIGAYPSTKRRMQNGIKKRKWF